MLFEKWAERRKEKEIKKERELQHEKKKRQMWINKLREEYLSLSPLKDFDDIIGMRVSEYFVVNGNNHNFGDLIEFFTCEGDIC